MDTRDDILAWLAERQLGAVSRQQLLERGWSGPTIDAAIRRGRLRVVVPGGYVVAGTPPDPRTTARALVLAAGNGAAVGADSAAAVHGWWKAPVGPRFHVTYPAANRPLRGSATVRPFRSRTFDPALDVNVVDDLPVTTPARTLLEVASRRHPRQVPDLVSRAIVRSNLSPDEIAAQADRAGRLRNIGEVRAALARLDPTVVRARSVVETRLLRICHTHGLPTPELGYRVERDGRLFEADAVILDWGIWIEVDGEHVHTGLAVTRHDAERQNALMAMGWCVLRYPAAVVDDLPGTVGRNLRAALLSRGWTPPNPVA